MGLSSAIPSGVAREVITQIKAGRAVHHGYLGVGIQDMDRALIHSLGLARPRGG